MDRRSAGAVEESWMLSDAEDLERARPSRVQCTICGISHLFAPIPPTSAFSRSLLKMFLNARPSFPARTKISLTIIGSA